MFSILCYAGNLHLFMAPEGITKGQVLHLKPLGGSAHRHCITGVGQINFRGHELPLITIGPAEQPLRGQEIIMVGQPERTEDTLCAA